MADKKISQYDSIVTPALTDIHEVVQGGVNYKETNQQLSDLLNLDFFGFDVQSIIRNPLNGVFFFTDFLQNHATEMLIGAGGSGASGQKGTYGVDATKKASGVLQLDTGTTNTGIAYLALGGLLHYPAKLGKLLIITRIAAETLSTVAEEYYVVAESFTDSITSGYGILWKYNRAVDGDFWTCITGVSPTATKTVTAIPVTTDYIWLATVINAGWSEVKFYYSTNGTSWTLAATHTTNIPQSGMHSVVSHAIVKSAGTTQRNVSADLFMFAYFFNR